MSFSFIILGGVYYIYDLKNSDVIILTVEKKLQIVNGQCDRELNCIAHLCVVPTHISILTLCVAWGY